MNIFLETERLYVRKFKKKDAEQLVVLNADPDVLKCTGDSPFNGIKEAQDFIDRCNAQETRRDGRYAVVRKKDEAFLGWCGLKLLKELRAVELDYRFHKKFWDQDYIKEVANAMIVYAFKTVKLTSIVTQTHRDNHSLKRVFESLGFVRVEDKTNDHNPVFLYKLKNKWYQIKVIDARETWPVRHPVLRAGRPLKDVYMKADEQETTFHLGAFYRNKIVGVASFMDDQDPLYDGNQSRLRGMAVLPDFRKRGIAEMLLKKGETLLKDKGKTLLWFNARIAAVTFYQNLDYTIDGALFDIPKVGPHYKMKKKLI